MRRLQVLALAALALSKGESYFAAAVPPRPLHQDAGLALSGCEAVLDTLFTMLRNPPQEFLHRTVTVSGSERPVPYIHTREFVDHSLQLLCGSALLARYRVDTALLGELSWRADPVPDYSGAQAATPVPAELHKLCRRMVKHHRKPMVDALTAGGVLHASACEDMAGVRRPTTVRERARALAAELRSHPLTLLKLLPFLIIAAAMPLMLAPLLAGPPAVPEPRGMMEPGDDGYDEPEQTEGCFPPHVSRAATTGKRKGKKRE